MEENSEVKKLYIWERIKYFFISPGKVFEQYIEKPTFLIKFLVIAVGVIFGGFAESTQKTLLINSAVDKLKRINYPEQYLETVRQQYETTYSAPMLILMGLLGAALTIAFVSFIYWLLTRFLNGANNYKDTVAVYSLAYLPQVIGTILISVYILMAHTIPFLDAQNNPTYLSTALSGINIFKIWQIVLLIIGLAKVGNISKKKAAFIVLLLTAIGILFNVGSFAVSSSLTGMFQK